MHATQAVAASQPAEQPRRLLAAPGRPRRGARSARACRPRRRRWRRARGRGRQVRPQCLQRARRSMPRCRRCGSPIATAAGAFSGLFGVGGGSDHRAAARALARLRAAGGHGHLAGGHRRSIGALAAGTHAVYGNVDVVRRARSSASPARSRASWPAPRSSSASPSVPWPARSWCCSSPRPRCSSSDGLLDWSGLLALGIRRRDGRRAGGRGRRRAVRAGARGLRPRVPARRRGDLAGRDRAGGRRRSLAASAATATCACATGS